MIRSKLVRRNCRTCKRRDEGEGLFKDISQWLLNNLGERENGAMLEWIEILVLASQWLEWQNQCLQEHGLVLAEWKKRAETCSISN